MSCNTLSLRTDLLPDADAGGTWLFDYYSDECTGSPSGATSTPPTGLVGDDPVIDISAYDPGCYYMVYMLSTGPGCFDLRQVMFEVIRTPDPGTSVVIDVCAGDAAITLFDQIGGTPSTSGAWGGSAIYSDDFDDQGNEDPTDDTFDPTTPGVYIFPYIVQPASMSGLEIDAGCSGCAPATSYVIVNVQDCNEACTQDVGASAFVTVCQASGCEITPIDELGGAPDSGGVWSFVSGPVMLDPTAPVSMYGRPVGLYLLQYSVANLDANCTATAILAIQVVGIPDAGINGTLSICDTSGPVSLITGLLGTPQTGGVWSGPTLPNGTVALATGTIDPAAGDAGMYSYDYTVAVGVGGPCADQCVKVATVIVTITAGCSSGAFNSVTVCQVDTGGTEEITLSAAALLGADAGGIWSVLGQSNNCDANYSDPAEFGVNAGEAEEQNGNSLEDGDVLADFANVGCILLQYACPGACTTPVYLLIQVEECAADCEGAAVIEIDGCEIDYAADNPENCDDATIEVQMFLGSWLPAPGTNNALPYTGDNGIPYRVKLSGCDACGDVYSNVVIPDCAPASCGLTCQFEGYDSETGEISFSWVLTGGSGNVVFQMNHAVLDNPANCSLSENWGGPIPGCPTSGADSGTATCSIAQLLPAQCVRFVVQDAENPACVSICYGLVPGVGVFLSCWQSGTISSATEITSLIVDIGSGDTEIIGEAQFNFATYDSQGSSQDPIGGMIQFILDINAWIAANSLSGYATLWQTAKQVSVRFVNCNFSVISLTTVANGLVSFTEMPSPCQACDTIEYHQQVFVATDGGSTYCGSSGSVDLMAELQNMNPDIPTDGEWHYQGGPTDPCGVIYGTGFTGTFSVDSAGVATWSSITWVGGVDIASLQTSYRVELPNGCTECYLVEIYIDDQC